MSLANCEAILNNASYNVLGAIQRSDPLSILNVMMKKKPPPDYWSAEIRASYDVEVRSCRIVTCISGT